jgi:uncharacterized protein (TIGR03437 family)
MRPALLLLLTAALAMAARLPVAFEPNRGQEPGQADFIVHTPGAALTLRAGRAEWISRQARVAVVFESTRRGVRGQGEDALPGVVNYLIGNEPSRWLKNIPTFSRVRYRELYPGIDVVYYVNDGRLEYDLVLARGADPGRVRLRVEGAQGLRLDEAGDLVIATAGGELRQHRPVIYQESNGERHELAGSYQLRGREVRFALGPYDRSQPLVIDPALTWASYLLPSPALNAQASSVALDSAGNIYMTGTVLATGPINEAFVAKLNPSGTTASETFIGGAGGNSDGYAIAVDTAGDIYLAGDTTSASFPADATYVYPYAGYSQDAFVMELTSAGNIVFSHYFGGSGGDVIYGLALDAADNVYVVGATNSVDMPISNGAAQTKEGGGVDAFVVAFAATTGYGVYSTYLGGSGDDYGNAIAVDAAGDAFVTGSTASSNFPVVGGAFQSTLKGTNNAFVAKIGPPTGALIYSTYLGGSGNDYAFGIAVDPSGATYITGETSSTNFPLVAGAYQSTYGGGASDAFVTRLAGSGSSLLYSTYLGGSGAEVSYGIAIDSTGNAYITGSTSSTNYPATTDAFQGSSQGAINATVTGLNASGSGLLFSSYLGGNNAAPTSTGTTNPGDSGTTVAVNCAAGLVVAGATSSTNFPTTSGAVTPAYPGGTSDAFVAQIAAGGGIPGITPGGVVNNATFATGPVAPGSIVSIFGTGLAPFAQTFTGFPLTTSLSGAAVTVDSVNAPVFYASSGQINIQLPFETGTGTAVMTVNNACGVSAPVTFNVQQAAPYILQTGTGQAILLNQDNTVNGPTNPAKVGSVAQIYLIGIGPVSNPVADGSAAPDLPTSPLSRSTLNYSATIGGSDSTVGFLGLAPGWVGLDQANLTVPSLSTGAYPVVITVGGVQSNGPTIYITQ